jgi:3-phenylpropionate/trans-cinnamate dioxygenase ferredoxin reductase subunit
VEQAMAVAKNLLAAPGEEKPYAAVPYVWSDQYDVSIQYVGHAKGDDEFRVKHGSLEEGRFLALYGREGRLRAAVSFNMFRELGDYRRLLAAGASFEAALGHVIEEDD